MNHSETLQAVLNYIDDNITDDISAVMLAEKAGYSTYHFSRIFTETIGVSVMSYVTWRKLQYAMYDLSLGKKVIDVAMQYGFGTHGGFTKAFVHWFGFPPSLCKLRLVVNQPMKPDVKILTNRFLGGHAMNPHIMELTPFAAVGYPSRHKSENIKDNVNASTFWNTINLDYGTMLTKLYNTFPKSKHFEICMCYDINESTGEFTYIMSRGIDNPDDLSNIQPDMTQVDIAGGLYAIFSTPPVEGALCLQTYQDTWNEIFLHWLPQSEFEYDGTRRDFSYHDRREHDGILAAKSKLIFAYPSVSEKKKCTNHS